MKTFKEFMEQVTPPKSPGKKSLLDLRTPQQKHADLINLVKRAESRGRGLSGLNPFKTP